MEEMLGFCEREKRYKGRETRKRVGETEKC
jgi:hypothetical protein